MRMIPETAVAPLVEALKVAATQFEKYRRNHAYKAGMARTAQLRSEASGKAEVNEALVKMCDHVLTKYAQTATLAAEDGAWLFVKAVFKTRAAVRYSAERSPDGLHRIEVTFADGSTLMVQGISLQAAWQALADAAERANTAQALTTGYAQIMGDDMAADRPLASTADEWARMWATRTNEGSQ